MATRHLLLTSFSLLLAGCPKPSASTTTDAGSVATSSSKDASSPADATTSTGPSIETPLKIAAVGQVIPAPKLKQNVPVTLSGVFDVAKSASDDTSACREELVLDSPIHVVDDKGEPATDGRGTGEHPVIGDATRVCIWGWKKPTQLPSGGRAIITGTLSTPIIGFHPRAILVFDGDVMAALPPQTPAPVGSLPDGDSVVYVRSVDATTRALSLDLAYIYWGDAAYVAAEATKSPRPAKGYFILDASPQVRTLPLPKTVSAERRQKKEGGGWEIVALDKLMAETQPFIVRVDKGAITELHEINLP